MRPGAVCVVELRHPGNVQVEHVLLHLENAINELCHVICKLASVTSYLLGNVVTIPGPIPRNPQIRLGTLNKKNIKKLKL